MKLLAKAALGALMLAGATAMTAAPAAAHVSIGIGIGGYGGYGGYGPGYYGGYYNAFCDPRSRWYDPYRCDDYGDDYYNGPVFIDGFWFNQPFRSRFHDGRREFFFHNSWRGGSGFHTDGFHHSDGGHSWGGGGHSWGGSGHSWGGSGHHH